MRMTDGHVLKLHVAPHGLSSPHLLSDRGRSVGILFHIAESNS